MSATTTLEDAVTDTLDRLGDLDNAIWSRAETELALQDGYDTFCGKTRVLFDTYVIENLPPVGNWQTDFEKYLAQQRSGWGLTDEPFHYTDDSERDNAADAVSVAGSYSGPSGMTSPSDRDFKATVDGSAGGVPTSCQGGTLPQDVVGVARVTFNLRDLRGISNARMRQIDAKWEERTGDPEWFIFDDEGMYYLRLVPAADGGATYDDIDGSWGTLRYTTDTGVTADAASTGGFGILRHKTGCFPSHGPWGTPRRIHPDTDNTKIEVYRLGLPLTSNVFEIPFAYQKYVIYYAMSRLLNRDGPGQDLALSEHFMERFEMGVHYLTRKRNQMAPEREAHFGPPAGEPNFGLGDPQASDDDVAMS